MGDEVELYDDDGGGDYDDDAMLLRLNMMLCVCSKSPS